MSRVVPDDPAIVQPLFEALKKNFLDGTIRNVTYRKRVLERLLGGYKEMMPEFDAALKKDLGQNAFQANVMSHTMTLADIEEMIENVEKWAVPEYRTTPICINNTTQPWVSPTAQSTTSPSESHLSCPPGTTLFTPESLKLQLPSLPETALSSSPQSFPLRLRESSRNCSTTTWTKVDLGRLRVLRVSGGKS